MLDGAVTRSKRTARVQLGVNFARSDHREEVPMSADRPMNAELTSGDHFAEVNPGDPLYRDLQLRGYNRRFVGTPDSVFVVDDTDQVVNAVGEFAVRCRLVRVSLCWRAGRLGCRGRSCLRLTEYSVGRIIGGCMRRRS